MVNNGWHSVYDDERPESGEEVLTLSYVGEWPAPLNMFENPDDRAYCVCTYFYPGDQDWNEVPGDPLKRIPTTTADVIFQEEGFYVKETTGPRQASKWRRIKDIKEGLSRGIVCWKELDYPSAE